MTRSPVKFDSDTEREVAQLFEDDAAALKWVRPASDLFDIYYRKANHAVGRYEPDFVAETATAKFIVEVKAANEIDDPDVVSKRDAAVVWSRHASEHAEKNELKPWQYVLVPHDAALRNGTLAGLVGRYGCGRPGVPLVAGLQQMHAT